MCEKNSKLDSVFNNCLGVDEFPFEKLHGNETAYLAILSEHQWSCASITTRWVFWFSDASTRTRNVTHFHLAPPLSPSINCQFWLLLQNLRTIRVEQLHKKIKRVFFCYAQSSPKHDYFHYSLVGRLSWTETDRIRTKLGNGNNKYTGRWFSEWFRSLWWNLPPDDCLPQPNLISKCDPMRPTNG